MNKHRDAGTGEYVTEEFAVANPGTTVEETAASPDSPAGLVRRVAALELMVAELQGQVTVLFDQAASAG